VCEKHNILSAYNETIDQCDHFKDKSLIVELPCKVGDDLFVISQTKDKRILPFINIHTCSGFTVFVKKRCIDVWCGAGNGVKTYKLKDFGKTVFLTKEDAERKLKEIEGK
jgi:hypothetical protein